VLRHFHAQGEVEFLPQNQRLAQITGGKVCGIYQQLFPVNVITIDAAIGFQPKLETSSAPGANAASDIQDRLRGIDPEQDGENRPG
jgi:hypothetical protein